MIFGNPPYPPHYAIVGWKRGYFEKLSNCVTNGFDIIEVNLVIIILRRSCKVNPGLDQGLKFQVKN